MSDIPSNRLHKPSERKLIANQSRNKNENEELASTKN